MSTIASGGSGMDKISCVLKTFRNIAKSTIPEMVRLSDPLHYVESAQECLLILSERKKVFLQAKECGFLKDFEFELLFKSASNLKKLSEGQVWELVEQLHLLSQMLVDFYVQQVQIVQKTTSELLLKKRLQVMKTITQGAEDKSRSSVIEEINKASNNTPSPDSPILTTPQRSCSQYKQHNQTAMNCVDQDYQPLSERAQGLGKRPPSSTNNARGKHGLEEHYQRRPHKMRTKNQFQGFMQKKKWSRLSPAVRDKIVHTIQNCCPTINENSFDREVVQHLQSLDEASALKVLDQLEKSIKIQIECDIFIMEPVCSQIKSLCKTFQGQ